MAEDVLAIVDEWEPDTVAVGVTRGDATSATHGPVESVLPFASVTKPLTAYAVLIAAQHGVLHLDEPVDDADVHDGVTIRHLLAHASGLPFEAGAAVQRPERRRVYSNWGFELLGDIVAERAGMPFSEHLDLEILSPLGMRDTVLDGSPAADASGTVTDLLAFARELLAPRLLDTELLAEATTTAYPGLEGVLPGYGRQRPCDWGLGFEIKDAKSPHWTGERLSAETFGHFGQAGSFVWVDPRAGIACAELASAPFGNWAKQGWPALSDAVIEAYA